MDLVGKIRQFFKEYKEPRYRDRRAWYASSLLADRRDLYWEATGEPVTNPTDLVGHIRMLVGKSIEVGLVNGVIRNLHWWGLHAVGSQGGQIPIGCSNPNVDGYLDALLVERTGDTFSKPYVLEIKTKNGYGADEFKRTFIPDDSYLAQIGLYLRDLNAKGVTNEGILLYILISDKNYGEMVQIKCQYDASKDTVIAYHASTLYGESKDIDHRLHMGEVLSRLKDLERAVETKQVPPSDYKYKYPVTPSLAAGMSDYELEKVLNGAKIAGDWQPKYSRYKDKHLKVDGITPEYTADELEIFRSEWQTRKPKSKKFVSK